MTDYIVSFLNGINLNNLTMPHVTITDIADILIVAYIIYRILVWIKETRAWSLFKGILILIVVSAVSYFFRLYTISWIVNYVFSMGLIAIIVLFQPELRNALEQIGRGKLLIPFSMNNEAENPFISNETVNAIIKAARTMANERTGALILIEQNVPLGDHEKTGIPIDSMVSSQLLMNIFVDKTPLHDGALIIKNNRIAAAACILPLTQTEIGKELGTRHRAAVGASEVSDAVIIVVSEETGLISVAIGGKLTRNCSDDKIRKMLSVSENEPKKHGLSRMIKERIESGMGGKQK